MKTLIVLLVCTISFTSCKKQEQNSKEISTKNNSEISHSLEGTWELVGYYNYIDNKVVDSFDSNEGYRQIKMYTPTKVMWSKDVPKDSTEWFGYGNYKINDSSLVETLEYGSESMKNIIHNRKEFRYELHLNENKFSQIELDDEGNRIYSENFKRIE